jgi:hypothetical protein
MMSIKRWIFLPVLLGLLGGCENPADPSPPVAAPAKPTVMEGILSLQVSWLAVSGAESYEVWYGTVDNSANAAQFGGDITGTNTVITGLTAGTKYYVWVRVKNGKDLSAFSPSNSGTPQAQSEISPPAAPAKPTVMEGVLSLQVSWLAVSGAESYEVWYGTVDNSTNAAQFGGDITGTSAVITGLEAGTSYYVWVKAKNTSGASDFSPAGHGSPQASTVDVSAVTIAYSGTPEVTAGGGGGTGTVTDDAFSAAVNEGANPAVTFHVFDANSHDGDASGYAEIVDTNKLKATDSAIDGDKTVYVFAKSEHGADGAAVWSANSITVTVKKQPEGKAGLNIAFTIEDESFTGFPGTTPTIYRSGGDATDNKKTLTVTLAGTYASYTWYVDGAALGDTDDSVTIDAAAYNPRNHTLTVIVSKDGVPYSKDIVFTVAQ